jgi:amino acid adenylation domain-containing protein
MSHAKDDISALRSGLSETKRALLEKRLRGKTSSTSEMERVPKRTDYGPAALSFAQQRLWFLDQLDPGKPFYNNSVGLRMRGNLNVEALKKSFDGIIARHEILRTAFSTINAEPVQVVSAPSETTIEFTDLSHLPEQPRELEAMRLTDIEAQRPFDLSTGPLLRVSLLKLDQQEYVLLLNMHHIISDGWSKGILVQEFAEFYEAYVNERRPALPELGIQYADYAVWQRNWLQGESLQSQLAYWKDQFHDAAPALDLPTDRPRPAIQSHLGACHTFSISRDLTRALKALSQRHGCTLFMTLLALFDVLLYRFSGQNDIMVGTPIANRNRVDIERLIGFFVNTLVVRARVERGDSFLSLLKRQREVALGAYANQDLPFEKLVEEIQPERSLSHTPLFQVMLVLQNAPAEEISLPGLSARLLDRQAATSKFDLTMTVMEKAEGLSCGVEYSTDLFDAATIVRLGGHFSRLAEAAAAEADIRVVNMGMLSEGERNQLLYEFNRTDRDYQRRGSIHEIFQHQAERFADRVAISEGGRQLSYGELNRSANRLASYLAENGVGAETLVGLCMERSIEMVIAMLSVLKAGGAYVPLDPSYPRQRLAYMLEDSQASVVVTSQHLRSVIADYRGKVVCLDEENDEIAAQSSQGVEAEVSQQNLAYIIYTSGSTGRPKGVAIQHSSAAALINWATDQFESAQLSGMLASTSICFDLSVYELFVTLCSGGKVILARDALELAEIEEKQEVEVINTVPSAMTELVRMGAVPAGVRTVNLAGEALSRSLVERIYEQVGVREVYNLYGPSEDTTYSTYVKVSRGESGAVTIGRPISNTRVYILDREMEPVPIGVAGEIYIGGEGLARGYLKRAELTADRFVPDSLGRRAGSRLYRTGDVSRYRENGEIEYLGRADHQVKVRGFRIELGEIEAALMQQSGVSQAVVVVSEDVGGQKHLVGYVVGEEGRQVNTAELKRGLMERLPEYMVPAFYQVMEEIPLTANGKVDRGKLPSIEAGYRSSQEEMVEPRTPVEEIVAGIWKERLGLQEVGVYDNFFMSGGHSLLATQVISRLKSVFNVELALRSLFEAPTIAGLAQRVEAKIRAGEGSQAPAIERVERGIVLPLSFAQQRLWFFNQMNPESRIYNILTAIKMEGELNVQSLERSLNEIVERHEILRTTFDMLDGEAVQVISPSTSLNIHKILLQQSSDLESNDELSDLIAKEAHHVFNLTTGPLLRATLIVLNQQEYVLLLNMHHIISDGWSMGVLIKELVTLYNAVTAGKPSPLPELAIQYADYAVWQRNWLQEGSLESQLLYWKEQLEDAAPVLDLPTDRPRPAVQSHRGAFHTFFISRDVTRSLKALSQREGCTLFMTLLALFDVLLCRYSGQNDILIGTPIANRNRVDIEKLIGFFVNTLVMRARVERGDSFLSLLKQQREVALGAYANQDLPFEKLVEELQPERNLSHTPLFQVLLVLQNAPIEELRLPGLNVKLLDRQTRTSAFDMTLAVTEKAEGLSCSVEYNADLFDEATMVRMGGHFSRLAEEAVGNADLRVIEMRMLGEEERKQLLYEFNRTEREYPRQASIHEIFRQQAERFADKVAISEGSRQLSYGELNRAANRVASYLVDRGVGAETFVGLCMERSIEMIIATLGVLKAGGAYVPLDPTYPTQRLGFMLEDTRPNVIICQEHLMEVLPGNKARIKKFEEMWEDASGYEAEEVGVEVDAECLAYVMYTSGSTGKPKGVSIPHRAVVWLVSSMDEVRVNETTIVAHGSNTAFDAATFEIWNALLLGGQMEVVSKQTLIDGAALRGYVEERGIEVLYLTAALFAQVASQEPGAFSRLGCVLYGGEAVDPRWAREVLKAGGPDRLLHLMGTTETTVFSSWHVVEEVRADAKRLSMGAAMPNVKYYVLDEEMEPVAMGVGGELYLGGEGEGRGYLNRPDLTAERFIPNPYSEEPGRRMYATGDILRMDERGEIEFVRRKDQQVKIRGYRIELGEIEGEVRKQEGVRESVVIVDEGVQTGKRLVCYVVEKQRGMVNKEEMRRRLRLSLPEYMVPAIYEVIEEIPLTANGKLDKAKLPRVEAGHRSSQEHLIGPRDNIELQLIQIWEKILGARYIAVTDNFFDLGGHSLSALRLRYKIRTTFKYELSLNSLFQSATIEHIAQMIRSSESALRSSSLIALRSTGSRPPFYCVHPGGGSVLGYLDLARALGSDQPFYGLQSPGLEGEGEVYTCIEDMAARYIQEIRSLQPEGPYCLGGWSLGGVIAFEMARQLKGFGKQIALLALIDSYAPANDHDLSRLENDSEIIAMFLRDFRGRMGKETTESYDDLKGKDRDWLLEYLLSEAESLGVLPPDAGIEEVRHLLNVFKANMNALKNYRPKAYSGRITLFRAETSSRNLLADNTSGWGDLTDDPIEVHLIPGNHYTMVARPNVQILAEKLGLCLDREQKLIFEQFKIITQPSSNMS